MADGGNLRAGIYERVSVKLTGKEARSVAQQNAGNKAACEQHGWTIAGHYADPGVSASRYARQKRREEYERMRADVAAGLLDVLVFWRINRADRKLPELAGLLEECRERRVLIYITVGQGRLYDMRNGSDWRQLANDAVAAAADADQISADVKRGMQDNLALGKPHGPTPWGYVRLYDEYRNITSQEPDPQTGPIRREIIARVAAGEALIAISRDLGKRRIVAPRGGMEWSPHSIRSLVLSPVNVAMRRYDPDHNGGADLTPGADWWHPIVDEDTWKAACARLNAAKRGDTRPGARHRYLLSYLAICGTCGGPLGVRSGRWSVPAYCCWKWGCTGMRHDWLDTYVTGALEVLLDTPAFWGELLRTDDPAVRLARAEAANLTAQLSDFQDRAAAGRISAESFEKVERGLLTRIRDAEHRAETHPVPAHLQELNRRREGGEGIRAALESWPLATRKTVLREVYDGIILLRAPKPGRNREFDPYRVLIVQNGKAR